MKKSSIMILILVLVSSAFVLLISGCESAQYDSSSFNYELYDNDAVITEYTGEAKRVIVPATIDGYHVFSLGSAFEGNTNVEEIVIEEGITLIGYKAFANCENLRSVSVPSTVQSLGGSAFENSGIRNIVLPEKVTFVGNSCFRGCKSLKYIKAEADEITLDEYSVFNTGIEYMQLKKEPRYYGNTFSEDCPFAYSSLSAFIISIKPLYSFTKFVQPLPAPLKAAVVVLVFFAVIGIIIAVILLVRLILIKTGKDKATIYRKYSSDFYKDIRKDNEKAVSVIYSRPRFFRDNLKYLCALVYFYLFLVGFWVVSDRIFTTGNIILRTLMSLFLMLGIIIAFFVIKRLIQGAKNKYYEKRNRLPKSTIRVRRLGRGHRHDQ